MIDETASLAEAAKMKQQIMMFVGCLSFGLFGLTVVLIPPTVIFFLCVVCVGVAGLVSIVKANIHKHGLLRYLPAKTQRLLSMNLLQFTRVFFRMMTLSKTVNALMLMATMDEKDVPDALRRIPHRIRKIVQAKLMTMVPGSSLMLPKDTSESQRVSDEKIYVQYKDVDDFPMLLYDEFDPVLDAPADEASHDDSIHGQSGSNIGSGGSTGSNSSIVVKDRAQMYDLFPFVMSLGLKKKLAKLPPNSPQIVDAGIIAVTVALACHLALSSRAREQVKSMINTMMLSGSLTSIAALFLLRMYLKNNHNSSHNNNNF